MRGKRKTLRSHPVVKRVIFTSIVILLSLIVLEVVLRLSGWFFLSLQEVRNRRSLARGTYRILALGESTTALGESDSWPSQLEGILNEQVRDIRFSVINKAVSSTNSWVIVSELEKNLDTYQPDIVITMMGVNDEYGNGIYAQEYIPTQQTGPTARSFQVQLSSFRVYKVFKYFAAIVSQVSQKLVGNHGAVSEQPDVSDQANPKEVRGLRRQIEANPGDDRLRHKLGVAYFITGKIPEAEVEFTQALRLNPNNTEAVMYLGQVYQRIGREKEAEAMYMQAIVDNPRDILAYTALGDMHSHFFENQQSLLPDFTKAEGMYVKATEVDPTSQYAWRKLAKFNRQKKDLSKAEQALKQVKRLSPDDFAIHMELGDLSREMGNDEEALIYYRKARELMPSLTTNYQLLRQIVVGRGLTLVAVQYPLRNIVPLAMMLGLINHKDMVLGASTDPGVILVDNEQVFRQAVVKDGYEAIFTDRFAGDFGHATARGNEILSGNIAETIIDKVLK
jgi:Flp pilus assembly protein TadD